LLTFSFFLSSVIDILWSLEVLAMASGLAFLRLAKINRFLC